MASPLQPIPNQPISNTHEWREWFFNLYQSLGGSQGLNSFNSLDFTGSNITSIANRAHNNLQGLQGGSSGGTEYYHLDAADYALVTSIPSGGLTVTITTAALTGGGTQGSMTFTNGILTAQTQAT